MTRNTGSALLENGIIYKVAGAVADKTLPGGALAGQLRQGGVAHPR
jgi:hypothetical protein